MQLVRNERRKRVFGYLKWFLYYMDEADLSILPNGDDKSAKRQEAVKQFKYKFINEYREVQRDIANNSIQQETRGNVQDFYWVLDFLGALRTDQIKWDITKNRIIRFRNMVNKISSKGSGYVLYLYKHEADQETKNWLNYVYGDILYIEQCVQDNSDSREAKELLNRHITRNQNILLEVLSILDQGKANQAYAFIDQCKNIKASHGTINVTYYDKKDRDTNNYELLPDKVLQIQDDSGETFFLLLLCQNLVKNIVITVNDIANQSLTDQFLRILQWFGDQQSPDYRNNIFLRICFLIERGVINYNFVCGRFVTDVCGFIASKLYGTEGIYDVLGLDAVEKRMQSHTYNELLSIARMQLYLLRLQLNDYAFVIADSPDKIANGSMGLLPIQIMPVRKLVTCELQLGARNKIGRILDNGGKLGNKVIYVVTRDMALRAKKDRRVLCEVNEKGYGQQQYLYWTYFGLDEDSCFREILYRPIKQTCEEHSTQIQVMEVTQVSCARESGKRYRGKYADAYTPLTFDNME